MNTESCFVYRAVYDTHCTSEGTCTLEDAYLNHKDDSYGCRQERKSIAATLSSHSLLAGNKTLILLIVNNY